MKAHRADPKPAFVPVILTLESQEEVDEMVAILTERHISPSRSIFDPYLGELQAFRSEAWRDRYEKLKERLSNR